MLPWLTAWARLIADDAVATAVAEQAVTRAASGARRLRGADLKMAARAEAARLLVRGVAAVPSAKASHHHGSSPHGARANPTQPADAASAFAPRAPSPAHGFGVEGLGAQGFNEPTPDPREQTAIGRLEIALEKLAPYERLACVSYFLDGASTDAVAAILGVPRARAITILETAAPVVASAVGDHSIPDFAATTDEVEVLVR